MEQTVIILILGLVLFLGVHSLQIVSPGIRDRVIERGGGVGAWKWPYLAVAAVGLILIIVGYGRARYNVPVVYYPPAGMRHLALLLMLPVFPLLFATYIKGRIGQLVGHPMLLATILWACAHLLANGSWSDIALFVAFLVWAVADWWSLRRRHANQPPRARVAWGKNDVISLVAGLITYLIVLGGLHRLLFGVSPL